MKKKVDEWSTEVNLTVEEAKDICRLGKGEGCCAFLVIGKGFQCARMMYPMNNTIFRRLEDGTMNAKGIGDWEGCAWHGKID